jgi:hypothetical protein
MGEENVFADDVTNALAQIFPNDQPRFLARRPNGYHDTALIPSELEIAGFSRVVIETRAEQSRASPPAFRRSLIVRELFSATKLRPEIGKTASCNRLRGIGDCTQTWQRRGCCQNSGIRNRGCGLIV